MPKSSPKVLIVSYSRTGITSALAKSIAASAGVPVPKSGCAVSASS